MTGLLVEERPEQLAVPILGVARLVEPALEQRLESPLCFRPCYGGHEGVRADDDLKCTTATHKGGKALGAAAAGMHSGADFDLSQDRFLARRESHVASEHEFAAHAAGASPNFRNADDWGLGEVDERIHQDGETGRPGGLHETKASCDIAEIKVGEVELRIGALEYYDTKTRAGVHASEQILEAFEHPRAHDAQRRIVEHSPPVRRGLLDDAQMRR